ncbi:MAG: D-alanine aminotransferase Dat [Calditrichaeota bacterium]|nr:D-alanine aminotransferase Dat [Calditrichota bacterium]
MLAYFNGEFIEEEKISVSPYERGFLFADGVYEVVRYYDDHFFQTEAHLKRMENGLKELRIEPPHLTEFPEIIEFLIKKNNLPGENALAYIQITRGAFNPRRHFFPPKDTPPTVLIMTSKFKSHTEEIENGVKVFRQPDLRWLRCDIKSIALLPNVLARQNAIDNGAAEAIFVRDGYITEGTHTNVCGIKENVLYTQPLSNLILSGITRQVVLKEICPRINLPVRERPIPESDLENLDELLLVGTTVEITPIVQVDNFIIGNSKPGHWTRKIQENFFEMTASKNDE